MNEEVNQTPTQRWDHGIKPMKGKLGFFKIIV